MTASGRSWDRTPRSFSGCEARSRLLALGVVLAGLASLAVAGGRDPTLGGRLHDLAAKGATKDGCWLYLPANYDRSKRHALVVALHAAGLRGTRCARQWGALTERRGGFIVVAPECRDTKRRLWKFSDEGHVLACIQHVVSHYSVDPRRVLLTGFSQGGIYTYTFGLRHPTVFRAIAPICGALIARPSPAAKAILERARGLPVYIVHGTRDDRIPVERARASRDRLERLRYQVTYREFPYLGHQFPAVEADRILAWFISLTAEPKDEKPVPRPTKSGKGPG